jgi:hypothetical protein
MNTTTNHTINPITNKKMKKLILFGCVALSLFAACDREKEPLSATELQAANAGKLPPDGNYIPFLYNAKWAYDNGTSIDTTYISRDTILKGKQYKEFLTNGSASYLRYADKKYYRLEANPLIVTDSTGLYERVELDLNMGTSKKYDQKFELVGGGYVRTETTLMAILKDRYVKGKKYNTVLEVLTRFYLKNGASNEYSPGTSYQYYGKDKGLIEMIETGGGKRLVYFNY